jgi:hypothetical protein
MRCKNILVFVFGVLLFSLVSASYQFSIDGSAMENIYQTNDSIEINLNMSFSNEPINSTFSDSFGNSITLGELLELDTDYYKIFDDLSNTTLSSAYQILKISKANFKVNNTVGNFTYRLNFKGEGLFENPIQIISDGNLVEQELEKKYLELTGLKSEIEKYDLTVQSILNDFLNISEIETEINELENKYQNSNTNEEYLEIKNNLSSIKMPITISNLVDTESISFYPSQENINLDVLSEIAGGTYGSDEEDYIGAVYTWNDKNLKTTLTYREILISYDSVEETILKVFRFEFDKSQMNENAYFVVENMQDLNFQGNVGYQMEETSYGYLYVNLNQVSDSLVLYTTQNVDFLSVPVFISPSLSDLTIPEIGKWEEWIDNTRSRWILFTVIVVLILLIGTITYVLLHVWYRKKYEAHLFKTRNNLFNIMTYIQNAKKKNMLRDDIIKNLKKAGWTGEQITYAMRKYEGKRILGLVRMPLNLTPDMEKKVEPNRNTRPVNNPNTKPANRSFNPNTGAEKKINQNKNTKV